MRNACGILRLRGARPAPEKGLVKVLFRKTPRPLASFRDLLFSSSCGDTEEFVAGGSWPVEVMERYEEGGISLGTRCSSESNGPYSSRACICLILPYGANNPSLRCLILVHTYEDVPIERMPTYRCLETNICLPLPYIATVTRPPPPPITCR